ncbi:MAG: FkbM family methyltransferase [Bacteroidetes bacterium]|nr:FkbM family methyltransferase [Bacteroidota bacterium]
MQFLKNILRNIIPLNLRKKLLPAKYKKYEAKPFERRFITIEDVIAGKSFQMYLREDSFMEHTFLEHGLYRNWEKESLKIWAELSKQADVIIDMGANTGVFSMLAQNNNSNATVVAIEPVDINYSVLSKNIAQNNFPVKAEKVALSNEEGTAKMFMLRDRLNYMTSVNDNRYALHPEIKGNDDVVEIEVPIKPFESIFNKYNLQKIDLIKIDVEGHEIAVLNSMMHFLEKFKPVILIEIIGDENAEQLTVMFNNLGYKYISINEETTSVVVDKLWDNDHHNFLLCHAETIQYLQQKGLVA